MADQQTVIGNANRMMVAAGRAPTLTCLEDVINQLSKTSLVIDAVQSGVGCNISVFPGLRSEEAMLVAVIRYLQDEVLQIDLSHISPTRVLQGCLPDVANLTEIIAALVCLEWQPDISSIEPSEPQLRRAFSDTMDLQHKTKPSLGEDFGTIDPPCQSEASTPYDQSPFNALPRPGHNQTFSARSLVQPSGRDPTLNIPGSDHHPGKCHFLPMVSANGSLSGSPSAGSGLATMPELPSSCGEISAASERQWPCKHDRLSKASKAIGSTVSAFQSSVAASPFLGQSCSDLGVSSAAISVELRNTGSRPPETAKRTSLEENRIGWQQAVTSCSELEPETTRNHRQNAQCGPGTLTDRSLMESSVKSTESCSYIDTVADSVRLVHSAARCGNLQPTYPVSSQDLSKHTGLSSCAGWSAESHTSEVVQQLKASKDMPMASCMVPVQSKPRRPAIGPHRSDSHASHPSVLSTHGTNMLHAAEVPHDCLETRVQRQSLHVKSIHRNASAHGMTMDRPVDVNKQAALWTPVHHSLQQTTSVKDSGTLHTGKQDQMVLKNSLDEDDAVLAAVIQDILDDENVQVTNQEALITEAFVSSVDVPQIVQQQDSGQQDTPNRMECQLQPHGSHEMQTLSQTCHSDTQLAGSDTAWAETAALQSDDVACTDSKGSSPASAPSTSQRTDAWASIASADKRSGSALASSETQEPSVKQCTQCMKSTTSPQGSPGNGGCKSAAKAKKGKRGNLCRPRKSSGKAELYQLKGNRRDLACSNPWLPNGKSGVGLVSTAVSPVKKRNDDAARKNYIKRHRKQTDVAMEHVGNVTLKDVHPIGGVRPDGGPTNAITARWRGRPEKGPAQGRLDKTLAQKLAHVVKLKEEGPVTLSRQARVTALAEEGTLNRTETQQKLEEKLARAQHNRELAAETRRAPLQDRAKRHALTVQAHKATMILTEAVNVLEKTRHEQAVAEQKFFRSAFLQAIEAEKEALLDQRKEAKHHIHALKARQTQAGPCHAPGRSSLMDSMQYKINSLEHELKTIQHDQKENQKQEVNSSMVQLGLQLQKLYADAQKQTKGQRSRDSLVERIRKMVQDTIFTS